MSDRATTVRQDNAGDPVDVKVQPGQRRVNVTTVITSTTVRTDRGSVGDPPTETEVTQIIHHRSKQVV